MNRDKQIERIAGMEDRLNGALDAVNSLSRALEKYEKAAPGIKKLIRYYGSASWLRDVSDDASGVLPDGLRRGVLSEDGIYDMLERNRETLTRALAAVSKALEEHTI